MTDNEIINALECCCSPKVNACDDCPFHKRCYENNEWLEKEAIDLINRQKAEIERLEQENFDRSLSIETWKWEAVEEFAERLDESLCKNIGPSRRLYWKISADIDNLVKEMVGEG